MKTQVRQHRERQKGASFLRMPLIKCGIVKHERHGEHSERSGALKQRGTTKNTKLRLK